MLLTLFAACGEKEAENTDPSQSVSDNTNNNTDDSGDDTKEIVEINYWMFAMGSMDDIADVEDAINAISEEEIGVHVNINTISFGDYGTQLTLAIANKEAIDLCALSPMPASSFMTLYSSGSLTDITALLDTNGSEIKELLGAEVLGTTSVDGEIYAVPTYRIMNSNTYLMFRKDVLAEAGVLEKAESMTTWSEMEEVLQAITDLGKMYAFGGQKGISPTSVYCGEKISDSYSFDTLGDSLAMIWSDQNGNVDLIYRQESVVDMYKKVANWYNNGWYYRDSAYSDDQIDVLISQSVYAGAFNNSEIGIESAKRQSIGTDMLCLNIAPGMVGTTAGRNWASAIPTSASEPEAAMDFLNLMYTNSDIMTLLIFGIEGTHYEVNENGEGAYLEGKDMSTSGYHSNDFAYGNQFLVLPWEGQSGDFREVSMADFSAATRSIYCGLSVDTGDYASLISAITAVKGEYYNQISCGMYSDATYAEYLSKLEAAGVDEYVALYQDAAADFLK